MEENSAYKGLNDEKIMQAVNNPLNKPVILNGVPQNTFGMNTQKPESDKTPIAGILFIIYFCAALFVGVGFAKVDKLISFTAIGSVFLVIGLSAAVKNGVDTPMILVVPYVGLLMTGIPISMMIENKHPGTLPFSFDSHGVLKIIFYSMAAFGVILLIFSPLEHIRKMSKCSQVITATCIFVNYTIKHGETANGRNSSYTSYSPVWQYEINNTIYVTDEYSYSNFETSRVGTVDQIRISPNEPWLIYRPDMRKVLIKVVIAVMWILLSCVAIAAVK